MARVVAKLAPNNSRLFLTTTHYHTEHVTGEPGFPPGTILIRNAVQQQELEKDGRVLTGSIPRYVGAEQRNQRHLQEAASRLARYQCLHIREERLH